MTAKEFTNKYMGKRVKWSWYDGGKEKYGVVISVGYYYGFVRVKLGSDAVECDVRVERLLVFDETAPTSTTTDLSHYPHTCPRCKKAAYIRFNNTIDCSANCGVK